MTNQTASLTFGQAIEALKAGKQVARAGWNGKGMYLWLLPAAMVKAEWCREPHLKAVAEANGGEIEALGSIRMMTADRKILTGWLASQSDVLAEDYYILAPTNPDPSPSVTMVTEPTSLAEEDDDFNEPLGERPSSCDMDAGCESCQ